MATKEKGKTIAVLFTYLWKQCLQADCRFICNLSSVSILTLCRSMGFSIKFDTINSEWSIAYIEV